MKSARATVTGMTRVADHATSIAAAEKVAGRSLTIRERVIQFALFKPYGFSDDDLIAAFPDSPESSFRKRRTELAAENVIVARGDTAKNRAGQSVTVWVHRDHLHYPPPLRAREKKPSRLVALMEENARLQHELENFFEEGVQHERGKIVAWLRRVMGDDPCMSPFAHAYAAQIERGGHRQ